MTEYITLPQVTAEFTVDYINQEFLKLFETPAMTITTSHTVKQLVGPEHPYFTWEESDEWYLRWAGIGYEVERTVKTTMPNCRVRSMLPNGDMSFDVLPSTIQETSVTV